MRGQTCRRRLHCLASQKGRQRGERKADAAFRQQDAQFVERAADAFLRGVFVGAERGADGPQIPLLKETQQDSLAVRIVEIVDGFVEDGRDSLPRRIAGLKQSIHCDGLAFGSVLI